MWGTKVRHCAECLRELTNSYMFDEEWVCLECCEKLSKQRNEKYYYNLLRDEIR